MVAVSTATTTGKCKASSFVLFIFLSALALACFIVLLSTAVHHDSFGSLHSLNNNFEKPKPLPAGSEFEPVEIVERHIGRFANTHSTVKLPKEGASQEETAAGPRGKSNFRNVVLPFTRQKGRKAGWMAKPHGHGVKPQSILSGASLPLDEPAKAHHSSPEFTLKAYVEPIDFKEWEEKPLPIRSTATSDQLEVIEYSQLNSCSRVPEMIPADEYPDHDPFLPWIHDLFPTHDGRYIQFVAQNRRRCHTGTTPEEKEILHLTQPNIALFQHVPLKRIGSERNQTKYRLASHEEADPDGIATRFICRFKPSLEETLSVYNFDYDYAAHRKRNKHTFQYKDGGIKSVHTSQLIFLCPVPESLVEIVRTGRSVKDDLATIFVDVIPIRTPPRYGAPNEFLQPHYSDRLPENLEDRFDPHQQWGDTHIIPRIEDSGRWENFPICKPSALRYHPKHTTEILAKGEGTATAAPDYGKPYRTSTSSFKKHRLIACIWASAGYTTRGNRFAINDGQRRLLEWIHYNKLLGYDHFYLYDNSYAFSNTTTLKPIADLFPKDVTYIKWPFRVCNNNPNNVDSPGERSSQYAAESSCRLRFGPHTDWIGQFDIDEYLVPMGPYKSLLPILDELESEGNKILSLASWRAWPRRKLISNPILINDPNLCQNQHTCFEVQVPPNTTFLQTYNCDRQPLGQKKIVMPAEKQLYKPDYVLQHFIHYSSVTVLGQMNRSEFEDAGYKWLQTKMSPDPCSRFPDELNEVNMLHTKAVARQDTAGWLFACTDRDSHKGMCRIGTPFPDDYNETIHGTKDPEGWLYNCYINQKTEHYWAPLLQKSLEEHSHVFDQKELY